MNIAEKLSTIANNVSKVYNAGYEQGKSEGVAKEEQEKTIDITENGTTEVIPDDGKVLSKVTVNVDVESGGGSGEEVVGVKYSNYALVNNAYLLPKTADARGLDNILENPNDIPSNKALAENGTCMSYMFANTSRNSNGGYFYNLEEVYMPTKAVSLSYTFQNCTKLKNLYGDLSNIITLSANCFDYCQSLTSMPFMPNLTTINNYAFRNCTGLTSFNLYKKAISIHAGAFTGCTNLLDIYVPWSEGEVANAPWGATNATIHYNTTYDENHNPIVPNGLVYELAEPTTFNGTSDYIDTGVKLYDTDKDFAILMEFENPTNDQMETLLHCMYEASPWNGVTMKVDGNLLFSVVGTSLMETFISTTGVTRLALAKVGEYYTLKVMHNGITSPQVLKEGNVGYASIPNNLLLGAYQDNDGVKGRFWSGTINSCKVYFDTLPTDDETNAFLMDGTVQGGVTNDY